MISTLIWGVGGRSVGSNPIMLVVVSEVERQQPEYLRTYFNERLAYYRERSKMLPNANSVQYLKTK